MDKLADLAEKFGPNVIEAARAAAQMEAQSTLMAGAMLIGCAILFLLVSALCIFLVVWHNWDEIMFLPTFVFGVAALVMLGAGAWDWIDPWTWTALHNPDLWLAKRALHL